MGYDVLKQGGGSGGGDDGSNTLQTADGVYEIAANQVVLLTKPPTDADPKSPPEQHVISILATGNTMSDGKVDVRGSQGVRITAGIPMFPPMTSDSTNGVEVAVGPSQKVTIQCSMPPAPVQTIELSPSGITVDAQMPIAIRSLTDITLSVAGGLSTITLGPQGVTIQGPLVQIN